MKKRCSRSNNRNTFFRSRNKYEVDHDTKRIKLDRVLYSAMGYPAEYGF